jgi:hypothetical protein
MNITESCMNIIKMVYYILLALLFIGIIDFFIICNKLDESFCDDEESCTFINKVKCFIKHRLNIKHFD